MDHEAVGGLGGFVDRMGVRQLAEQKQIPCWDNNKKGKCRSKDGMRGFLRSPLTEA
jgi:hypothetical protein